MQIQSTLIKIVGQGLKIQIGGTRLVYASPSSGLTNVGKYKLGARVGKYKLGARTVKYKLGARAGKHKLGTRAGKYKLGATARGQGQSWGPNRGPGAEKYKYPPRCSYINIIIYIQALGN